MSQPRAFLGVYDVRPIDPGDLNALVKEVVRRRVGPAALAADYAALYTNESHDRSREYHLLCEDRDLLTLMERRFQAGEIDEFRFHDRRYDAAEAPRLLKKYQHRLEEENEWWADFDRRVFLVYYHMAKDLGAADAEALRSHYEFHLALQRINAEFGRRRRVLSKVAAFVRDGDGPLHADDFHEVRRSLMEVYDAFERCLVTACKMKAPRLASLPPGQPLANVLLSGMLVKRIRPVASSLPAGWLNKFRRQMDEVRQNLHPVLSESLAGLLALQGSVARRWAEEMANLPEVEEAEVEELEEVAEPGVGLQSLDDAWGADGMAGRAGSTADRTGVELADPDEEPEFEVSEKDVLAEPEEAGGDIELEDLDAEDDNKRPRNWNL